MKTVDLHIFLPLPLGMISSKRFDQASNYKKDGTPTLPPLPSATGSVGHHASQVVDDLAAAVGTAGSRALALVVNDLVTTKQPDLLIIEARGARRCARGISLRGASERGSQLTHVCGSVQICMVRPFGLFGILWGFHVLHRSHLLD